MHSNTQNSRKTVAFVTCAPHQKRFFRYLQKHLPPDVDSVLVDITRWWSSPRSLTAYFAALSKQSFDPRLEEMIALDFRKRLLHQQDPDGKLRRSLLAKASVHHANFARLLRDRKIDLVVVWNGFQAPVAACVAAARAAGVNVLFCENGYLPQTIVMDPKGINAGNSLAGLGAGFYRNIAANLEKFKALLDTSVTGRPLRGGMIERFNAPTKASENFTAPEQFVFLPLQVHDDSQILLYSPDFPDMPSVIRFCAAGVAAYNAKHSDTLKLVVKEHPSDYAKIDYDAVYRDLPDVLHTRAANTQDLIAGSRAVITVNSTVGIEALLRFKPVITLGRAFYAIPGIAQPCGRNDDLATVLRDSLETPVDRDLIGRFLYYLRYMYLVAIDKRNPAASDPAPAIARIIENIGSR